MLSVEIVDTESVAMIRHPGDNADVTIGSRRWDHGGVPGACTPNQPDKTPSSPEPATTAMCCMGEDDRRRLADDEADERDVEAAVRTS